jgi:hypothetical protein
LIFHTYLKDQKGKAILTENNKYSGQLSYYLQDCQDIQLKLEKAKYTKTSLENLFLEYYKTTKKDINFQNTRDRIHKEFGVLAGLTDATLQFRADHKEADFLTKARFNNSLRFLLKNQSNLCSIHKTTKIPSEYATKSLH